jgi:hypothetical protein
VKQAIKKTQLPHQPAGKKPGSRKTKQEEEILRQATLELISKHGGHFVATGLRETRIREIPVWIITVTLRYMTGFAGYIGDLLYDGVEFTFLTEQSIIDERVRQIAADPERIRHWHTERRE